MLRLIIKSLDAVFLVFFAYAAIVQYNDPDAALWIAAYGGAALACGLHLLDRLPKSLGLLVSGGSLLWALYLVFRDVVPVGFWDPTGVEMVSIRETGRESVGLFIVAAWVGFLTWRVWRERKRVVHAEA